MTTAAPTPSDVLEAVRDLGPPGTPVTTPEVAEGFDCTKRTIYNRLDALVEDDILQTKKVGANSRVWWQYPDTSSDGGERELTNDSLSFLSGGGEMAERINTKYRSLFEEMKEGFALCELVRDADGRVDDIRYVELNEAFEELTGVDRTDAEGRLAGDVFPGQDDSFFETYGRVAEAGEPTHVENYVPANDRWYDVRMFPREGDLVAVLYDDITERKTAELHHEERYRTLSESIDEGFCIIEVLFDEDDDPVDYRFLETNPAFEAQTGLTDAEGKRMRALEPNHEEYWFEIYGGIAQTGEPERFTNRAEHLDDRWYDVYAFRIGDPEDRTVAILFNDVSERKQAELEREQAMEALRESEERYRTILNSMDEGFFLADVVFDDDGEPLDILYRDSNPAATEFTGEEYTGRWLSEIDEAYEEYWYEVFGRVAQTGEGERDVLYSGPDGIWCDFYVFKPEGAGSRRVAIIFQNITKRKETEEQLRENKAKLERLNAAAQELIDAEAASIADRVAGLVREVLDVEYATLWQYDERTGDLRESAFDADPDVDGEAVEFPIDTADQAWDTFVRTDIEVENDLDHGSDVASPVRSRAFVPLGRHGVICLGSSGGGTFDEQTVDLVKTVAATVEAAWDHADSEMELARQNEELSRLDRLNTLIRTLDQALLEADTRKAIDEAVCKQLATSELFESAWIATYDADTDTLGPVAWSGVDSRYLEDRTVTVGDASGDDPLVAAHRTWEMQVVSDIAVDSRTASWREDALERGARSCFTIPLLYEESMYGILTVFGSTPQPDDRETEVLSEFGRTISHAISAVETRVTLQADSVVELTLRTTGATTPLCRLARTLDCPIEFEGLVPGADDGTTVFFTVSDVSTADVLTADEAPSAFEDLTCLVEGDETALFRTTVTEPTMASLLIEGNTVVRSLTIDSTAATAVVDVFQADRVGAFLDTLRESLPGLELLARRTQSRPLETRETFRQNVEERLTPRQHEVLLTAYRSGFFQSPRPQTGKELATVLDISPPTFTTHLRGAQRRLFEMVFDSP